MAGVKGSPMIEIRACSSLRTLRRRARGGPYHLVQLG